MFNLRSGGKAPMLFSYEVALPCDFCGRRTPTALPTSFVGTNGIFGTQTPTPARSVRSSSRSWTVAQFLDLEVLSGVEPCRLWMIDWVGCNVWGGGTSGACVWFMAILNDSTAGYRRVVHYCPTCKKTKPVKDSSKEGIRL